MLQLFLLFTIIPLVELWLLFQLSGLFGFWPTILIVLLTGIVGAALARWQGWQAIARMQDELQQGLLPTKALGEGVLILVAGVLLITPGVITDVVGLLLLVPPVRSGLRKGLQLWLARHVQVETTAYWHTGQPTRPGGKGAAGGNVVEGRVVDAHIVDSDHDGAAP